MNRDNFINMVGYQFEKMHTGIIKWLLDSSSTNVPKRSKFEILSRLYTQSGRTISFSEKQMAKIIITCTAEYSIPTGFIDLLVKIEGEKQRTQYLVIEMKTDSVPDQNQLKRIRSGFQRQHPKSDVEYFLFSFGVAQVCQPKILHGFHAIGLQEIASIFGTSSRENMQVTWLDALQEESRRAQNIVGAAKNFDILKKEDWRDRGYRTDYVAFCYLYDHLRSELELGRFKKWSIYYSPNNPIMYWDDGKKEVKGYPGMDYYWEFNYQQLCLKISFVRNLKPSREDLMDIRERVSEICEGSNGYRTRNTIGKQCITVYKWDFDFTNQTFKHIAQRVHTLIGKIHHLL